MSPVLALKIDPYTRSLTVVVLHAGEEPPASYSTERLLRSDFTFFTAAFNCVPVSHWKLFEPLVHEGRTDTPAEGVTNVSTRPLYRTSALRAMIYMRDDVPDAGSPERLALPGFAFRDSRHPGVWWSGVAYVSLYHRRLPQPVHDRDFLERTRQSVSWERLVGYPQLSRHRFSLEHDGSISSRTLAVCSSCNAFLEYPKRCSRCMRVNYCSEVCQRAHWRQHRAACRASTAS